MSPCFVRRLTRLRTHNHSVFNNAVATSAYVLKCTIAAVICFGFLSVSELPAGAAPSFECLDWVVGSARQSNRLRAEAFRVCDRLAILPETSPSMDCARWVIGSGTSTMDRRATAAAACRFNVSLDCTEFLMHDQGNFFAKRLSAARECQQPTNDVRVFHEFDRAIAEWISGTSPSHPARRMTIANASRGGAGRECAKWVLGNTVGDVDARVRAVEACNHVSGKNARARPRDDRP